MVTMTRRLHDANMPVALNSVTRSPLKPDRFAAESAPIPKAMNPALEAVMSPLIPDRFAAESSPIDFSYRDDMWDEEDFSQAFPEDDVEGEVTAVEVRRKPSKELSREERRRRRRERRKNRKNRRRIRFSKLDTAFEIPHINDMTDAEVEDCWFGPEDFRSIRVECMDTVKEVDAGKQQEGYFLRGLDQHTLRYKERRDEVGRQVYLAVFEIQTYQWATGVDASDLIAQASQKYSQAAVAAAHMAAISDLFSAFKNTWTERHIPTVELEPSHHKVTYASKRIAA